MDAEQKRLIVLKRLQQSEMKMPPEATAQTMAQQFRDVAQVLIRAEWCQLACCLLSSETLVSSLPLPAGFSWLEALFANCQCTRMKWKEMLSLYRVRSVFKMHLKRHKHACMLESALRHL